MAVEFGQLPVTDTTPLTPYENLKLLTPLPSSTQALIVFRGVTAGGKSATFTLVGEAILHGEVDQLLHQVGRSRWPGLGRLRDRRARGGREQ